MFGTQGGECAGVVSRKTNHMNDARQEWPFLTVFDCSTIKTEGQLLDGQDAHQYPGGAGNAGCERLDAGEALLTRFMRCH